MQQKPTKRATVVETLLFVKKVNLTDLKSDVDKLNADNSSY